MISYTEYMDLNIQYYNAIITCFYISFFFRSSECYHSNSFRNSFSSVHRRRRLSLNSWQRSETNARTLERSKMLWFGDLGKWSHHHMSFALGQMFWWMFHVWCKSWGQLEGSDPDEPPGIERKLTQGVQRGKFGWLKLWKLKIAHMKVAIVGRQAALVQHWSGLFLLGGTMHPGLFRFLYQNDVGFKF